MKKIAQYLAFTYGIYSIQWTILEPILGFFTTWKPDGIIAYPIMVMVSVLLPLIYYKKPKDVTIAIPNSSTRIKIYFGDLFKESGSKVIAVNEFFDSEIGDKVSPATLHGKFIKDILGGQSESFDRIVGAVLEPSKGIQIDRPSGKTIKYPIGTTARVTINEQFYFLVALTRTDIQSLRSSATVTDFWLAMDGLWKAIASQSNGLPVYIPLIGAGQSGVGLDFERTLEMILISIGYHSKIEQICQSINIVIHPSLKHEIDLGRFDKMWR